jgi:hypothetical protein
MSDLLGICLNADKIRLSGFQAAVENRAANGLLGLLCGKTPRPQLRPAQTPAGLCGAAAISPPVG